MEIGHCRLCLRELPLLKRSHIIPDFYYRAGGLFDENHQLHKIQISKLVKENKTKLISDGIYDSNILCTNCDNEILGNLERYASKFFFGIPEEEEHLQKKYIEDIKGQWLEFKGVSYKKLKLHLLSILWRAAILKIISLKM